MSRTITRREHAVPARTRSRLRTVVSSVIAVALALGGAVAVGSSANAYGPSVMFTGTSPDPGYSRAIVLHYNGANNGKMLAIHDWAVTTMPNFPVYESTNAGSTWSQVGTVSDTQNGWGLRYQPHMIELPQAIGGMAAGTLLVAGNSIPSDGSATKIDLYKSTDIGRTWTFVSSIATGGAANPDSAHDPVWEPFLLVANNKLIVYYSDERDPAHNQKLVHQTSTNGTTWSSVVDDVALANSGLRPGMSTIAQMANGQWIMTYELAPEPGWPVNFQISSNPEVWSPTSPGTTIGYGGTPYVVTMPNGKIVVSMLEHTEVFTNSANGTGAWSTLATPLTDGYSRSLTVLDNGRLFLTTGDAASHIVYADMDAGGTTAKFINRTTGNALDNTGSTTAGTNVAQWANITSNNLLWKVLPGPDGYLRYQSVTGAANGYLDSLGRTTNGQNVGQTLSSTSNNQLWKTQYASGYQRLVNKANGLAVDTGGLSANGSPMQMWAVSTNFNQQWTMVPQN